MKRWKVTIEVDVISDGPPSLNYAIYALRKIDDPHFMPDWNTLKAEVSRDVR